MELRYGVIDENVRKRSVEDIILHERQTPAGIPYCRGETGWEGLLAVTRAVNRLAAGQCRAGSFSPFLLLPPGTQEETLRDLYRQICRAAFASGLEVTGGYVEVTDAVNRPVVTGEMTGKTSFSQGHPAADPDGWDIIAAGEAGLEGTFLLVSLFPEELQKRFPMSILVRMEQVCHRLCILPAARIIAGVSPDGEQPACQTASAGPGDHEKAVRTAGEQPAAYMVSLSAGGIFAGLWELASKTGCGLDVDLPAIPLLQETIEITDHFGINPYMMRSEGCLLAAVPDGERVVRDLRRADITASRIGVLRKNTKDKIIRSGEEIRSLDRPRTDTLDLYLHHRYAIEQHGKYV